MTTKRVSELVAGDMIDLEGIDIFEANGQIWPFEYATVESVSTVGNLSGGWEDGYLANPANAGYAIIYVENGAANAVVPVDTLNEPSTLDLAVQRAQELADYYDTEEGLGTVHSLRAKDLRELLDLFRAAR